MRDHVKILAALAGAIVLSIQGQPALAQIPSARGMATVEYDGVLSTVLRRQALANAKFNALERYVQEINPDRARVFAQQRQTLEPRLAEFILSEQVLAENDQPGFGQYALTVRVEVNAPVLETALRGLDGGPAVAGAVKGQGIALIFMARTPASRQMFADRAYSRAEVQGRDTRTSSVATVETGGSVTRRADKVEWQVQSAENINAAMTGVFADAGIDAYEAAMVEAESGGLLQLAQIQAEFGQGDELSSATLRQAADGVRNAQLNLMALGVVDTEMTDIDPATGNSRVHVTVRARLIDLSGRLPRTLSSIGPVSISALGENETAAGVNAVNLASRQAAQQMVDQLALRGSR